jgi:hypothetical protein
VNRDDFASDKSRASQEMVAGARFNQIAGLKTNENESLSP